MAKDRRFHKRITGQVLWRGDNEYETIRTGAGWSGLKPDRYPDVIIRAAGEDDVVEAVRYARSRGMKVAVRGGGHSWCASSLRDGGMLLDLGSLNAVAIRAGAREAVAQPAATNGDLARALGEHDLAFPVGHCSSVPLSGFLLNGGIGWNAGAWGISCFSVLGMDVVTAQGELVYANESENPELFWAARGAGPGFFGVVTRYKLRLYPLPKAISTSTLAYPLERVPEVVDWAAQTVPAMPPSVETVLLMAGGLPSVPSRQGKVCLVMSTAFADSEEEARDSLAPLAAGVPDGCMNRSLHAPTPFEALLQAMDAMLPKGRRYAVDTVWSGHDPRTVMNVAHEHYQTAPSDESVVLSVILPPPPPGAPGLPDAAFSMVAPFFLAAYAIWQDAGEDKNNTDWLRSMMGALEPHTAGRYIGETDLTAGPSRSAGSFATPNWERLQALRRKHDPEGLFYTYLGQEG